MSRRREKRDTQEHAAQIPALLDKEPPGIRRERLLEVAREEGVKEVQARGDLQIPKDVWGEREGTTPPQREEK